MLDASHVPAATVMPAKPAWLTIEDRAELVSAPVTTGTCFDAGVGAAVVVGATVGGATVGVVVGEAVTGAAVEGAAVTGAAVTGGRAADVVAVEPFVAVGATGVGAVDADTAVVLVAAPAMLVAGDDVAGVSSVVPTANGAALSDVSGETIVVAAGPASVAS